PATAAPGPRRPPGGRPVSHPTPEQLRLLLVEELPHADRDRLEAHVNDCDECLQRLEDLQRRRPGDDRHLLAALLLEPPPTAATAEKREREGGREEHQERHNGDATPGPPPGSPTVPLSPSGLPLFAGYEILERVGSGGMGEVYRARHLRTSRV